MKRLKHISILIFVVSVLLYVGYKIYDFIADDRFGPIIEIEQEELRVSISADQDALLEGVTATDSRDGDVTDSIVIESISNFIDNDKRIVTYAAFDKNHHVGKATREVTYVDYTSPEFSCKEPFRFPVNSTNFISAIMAKDCIDGDITDKIKISPGYSVVTDTPGDYPIQIQVANSSGDVEYLPITVEIYDPTDRAVIPVVELKKYIVYTKVGKKIDPLDYVKGVRIGAGQYKMVDTGGSYSDKTPSLGGTLNYSHIDVDGSIVDYNKPGAYELTYSMSIDGEQVGKTRMIIVVRDAEGN